MRWVVRATGSAESGPKLHQVLTKWLDRRHIDLRPYGGELKVSVNGRRRARVAVLHGHTRRGDAHVPGPDWVQDIADLQGARPVVNMQRVELGRQPVFDLIPDAVETEAQADDLGFSNGNMAVCSTSMSDSYH